MNYYISDLHLFHEASIKYDNRPFCTLEEMNNAIMKNWNDTAHKETYHLVLSHYPVFSWNGMNRGAILLYGHVHEGAEDTYFQKCIGNMQNECRHAIGQDVRAYNVGCMKSAIDYIPRTLEEIIDRNEEMKMVR